MVKPIENVRIGCDPELFLKRNGHVIGSEKVIPEKGIIDQRVGYRPVVVRDGIQVELNPPSAPNNQMLGMYLGSALESLSHAIQGKAVEVCFDGMVEVSRAELDSLSPESQVLGCNPSENIYGAKPIEVDAKEYKKRSAGGHLHFGLEGTSIFDRYGVDSRTRAVPLLDIFVGTFGVLLDRDPNARERRENYGRAGEYRLPEHGLEYRTPSNFWLRSYSLMSFMFGMSRFALTVLDTTLSGRKDLERELVELINIERVIEAINTNNFNLALVNLTSLRPFLWEHSSEAFPIHSGNMNAFIGFCSRSEREGIEKTWPTDKIMTNWMGGLERIEFEDFLDRL